MNADEQRIAIAEWCGVPAGQISAWLEQVKAKSDYENAVPGGEAAYTQKVLRAEDMSPPDYLNDLNAMWDAEEKLTDHSGYWQQLEWIIGVPLKFSLCHATAAQRAEALLRTIGKWTDSTLHTKG